MIDVACDPWFSIPRNKEIVTTSSLISVVQPITK